MKNTKRLIVLPMQSKSWSFIEHLFPSNRQMEAVDVDDSFYIRWEDKFYWRIVWRQISIKRWRDCIKKQKVIIFGSPQLMNKDVQQDMSQATKYPLKWILWACSGDTTQGIKHFKDLKQILNSRLICFPIMFFQFFKIMI